MQQDQQHEEQTESDVRAWQKIAIATMQHTADVPLLMKGLSFGRSSNLAPIISVPGAKTVTVAPQLEPVEAFINSIASVISVAPTVITSGKWEGHRVFSTRTSSIFCAWLPAET